MDRIPRLWSGFAATLALAGVLAVPARAWAGGCEKDTDCKGDRICVDGVCEEPSQAAPPAVQQEAPPPPPEQPPPPPPPPGYYSPAYPPPAYAPPPPLLPRFRRTAHSFLTIGGVGYLLPPIASNGGVAGATNYGGMSFEYLRLFPIFGRPGFDGGFTLDFGEDLAFAGQSAAEGLSLMNTGWMAAGFDFGLAHFLQLGPRIGVGYLLLNNTAEVVDGILMVGGHANLWITHFFGFYFEADAMYAFINNFWAPRLAGGLAFGW